MLIWKHMDRLVVLSSFEQCTDVSREGCSELSSLGVHLCELQKENAISVEFSWLRGLTTAVELCQRGFDRCFKQLGV